MLHIVYHSAIFSDRFGNVMHGAKFDIKLFELKHLSPRIFNIYIYIYKYIT